MRELPFVSVVIPIYNVAPYLRQCLDSVAEQTLNDIEIICVDDGSTDESPNILREYEEKDKRFYVVRQQNGGPGKARNTGFDLATGKYLIFLDSDDWFEKKMLEEMTDEAEKSKADIVICRAEGFDTNTKCSLPSDWMLKKEFLPNSVFTPQEIGDHLFQFTYGWPWDKLYRREFIKKKGLLFPALPNSEYLVFVFQSLAAADKMVVMDQMFVHHRTSRMSSVSNSRHRDPGASYSAVKELKAGLVKEGTYKIYEKSYLNWAMDFLVWNAANMGDGKAQRYYLRQLKRHWLPELELEKYPANYYENRILYLKYLLMRYAPNLLFSAIVSGYHFCKKIRGLWNANG